MTAYYTWFVWQEFDKLILYKANLLLLTEVQFLFQTIMQVITDFGKIQTFYTKYRPNKDPFCSKGLYYRPRSLNKDPAGSTGEGTNIFHTLLVFFYTPSKAVLPTGSLFKDLGL